MHFDDRLATVLAQTAAQGPLARIVYRQLVDILGRLPASARSPLVEESFARLEALSRTLPVATRAQILAEPTMRLGNPRLVAALLESDPLVAVAALDAARLDEMEWLTLIPRLPIRARGVLRHRGDLGPAVEAQLARLGIDEQQALPPAAEAVIEMTVTENATQEGAAQASAGPKAPVLLKPRPADKPAIATSENSHETAAAEDAPSDTLPENHSDISDIVRRIEAFRKARAKEGAAPPSAPPLRVVPSAPSPSDAADDALNLTAADEIPDDPTDIPAPTAEASQASRNGPLAVDFATDGAGRIEWAEAPCAGLPVGPSFVGFVISGADTNAPVQGSPALNAAFEHRQPLRNETVTILGAPAVAGRWHIDAVPRFDPNGGAFIGYAGRLRRPNADDDSDPAQTDSEDDRMRQILHELRTPANAIQVAAEVIQHGLFGPVAQEYRAISAGIAGDAALVLAGFDELDRLVRLETGALVPPEGTCDLTDVLGATIDRLSAWMEPRDCGFGLTGASHPLDVWINREEGEMLAWRVLASLAGHMAPGEWLGVACRANEGSVHVRISLPNALAGPDKEDLFAGAPFARSLFPEAPGDGAFAPGAGMFGVGFTLRLAKAEASAAGGGLRRDETGLDLWLPEATEPARLRA